MYRMLFPRVIKHRDASEVLFKTYVSSTKMYEFGPLLAGREPELYVTSPIIFFYLWSFVLLSENAQLVAVISAMVIWHTSLVILSADNGVFT